MEATEMAAIEPPIANTAIIIVIIEAVSGLSHKADKRDTPPAIAKHPNMETPRIIPVRWLFPENE
jgi:hypothetical protein